MCRDPLKPGHEYRVSFNLEEAARFYQLIKDKIDLSTIIDPTSIPDSNVARDHAAEMIHNDEIYARRLHAELNRQNGTVERPNAAHPRPKQPEPVNRPADTPKSCGHGCDLVSTVRCCPCLGKANPTNLFFLFSVI